MIQGADVMFILAYALLILVYSGHLKSRQNIAAVVGYTLLLIAKRFEYIRGKSDKLTTKIHQMGYIALLFSPSFAHWYDILAIIGFVFSIFGFFDESSPFLSLYHVLGANQTSSYLSMTGRSMLGMALVFGYKSPLQYHSGQ